MLKDKDRAAYFEWWSYWISKVPASRDVIETSQGHLDFKSGTHPCRSPPAATPSYSERGRNRGRAPGRRIEPRQWTRQSHRDKNGRLGRLKDSSRG
jgi:hypothetical protein